MNDFRCQQKQPMQYAFVRKTAVWAHNLGLKLI